MINGTWLPSDLTDETRMRAMASLMTSLAKQLDWVQHHEEDEECTRLGIMVNAEQLMDGLALVYKAFQLAESEGDPASMSRLAWAVATMATYISEVTEQVARDDISRRN